MGRQTVLVLAIASAVFLGLSSAAVLKQCTPDRECVPFTECPDYQDYNGTPWKNWPSDVQNEVLELVCGRELLSSGKNVYKICCFKQGRRLLDLNSCGKNSEERIAHGKIAAVFQFPWMALLQGLDGKFHCGGTLIAQRYVLTAMHCRRKQIYSVRLGETDLSTAIDCKRYGDEEEDCADPAQDILVDRFIKHPTYSFSQKKNDIALIKLASAAQLSDSVRPICLPLPEFSTDAPPAKMVVSGWGFTENDTEVSNQLRYAYVPIVDLQRCNESLARISNFWSVDESQVCAGAGKDKADNCQGDSGGPLKYVVRCRYMDRGRNVTRSTYVVHGVVSFGQASCGTESEPGIYAKVQHYLSWIIDNLQ